MSNVYVIGEQNVVLPFRGVGAMLLPVSDRPGILDALNRIKGDPEAGVVFIAEEAAAILGGDALGLFREQYPGVAITIPTRRGGGGQVLEEMRSLVARAIGVDLMGRTGEDTEANEHHSVAEDTARSSKV